MSFQIGQKVVCVDAKERPTGPLPGPLKKDAIYTIREVYLNIGVRLEEIQGPICEFWKRELGFRADRFRPIRETNIDVFTRMLEPAPVEA